MIAWMPCHVCTGDTAVLKVTSDSLGMYIFSSLMAHASLNIAVLRTILSLSLKDESLMEELFVIYRIRWNKPQNLVLYSFCLNTKLSSVFKALWVICKNGKQCLLTYSHQPWYLEGVKLEKKKSSKNIGMTRDPEGIWVWDQKMEKIKNKIKNIYI